MMDENKDFYCELPGFSNFAQQALDNTFYRALPDNWVVVIADIVSSTDAVEGGRYQEVNYVGAACIAALQNAIPDHSIPTVFGGDGATAAVSGGDLTFALTALSAVREWAMRTFSLELRVGAVPVSEIKSRGEQVEIGKLDLGHGNELAMFRGAGFELADQLVKEDLAQNPFLVALDSGPAAPPDLSSLSCRWSPLAPTHDVMLCLLIEGHESNVLDENSTNVVYRDVLDKINEIVEIDAPSTNPVKTSNLKFRLNHRNIIKEIKSATGSWFKRLVGVPLVHLFAAISFRYGYKTGTFDPVLYQRQILSNSDYKRINGTIQLILDCTSEQSAAIERMLGEQYQQKKINYGLYRADSALMTCITPDISNGKHIHYIDGSDGGFWHAANTLKMRRSRS